MIGTDYVVDFTLWCITNQNTPPSKYERNTYLNIVSFVLHLKLYQT